MATASPATAAISLASNLVGAAFSAIAQHSLRLRDAKAENSAVPQAVDALQQDFDEIAGALSSGEATPREAIAHLIQMESSIEGFLKSLVGKPGTAWAGSPSGCPGSDVPKTENGSHPCDKGCTAGCCIFFNYLEPAVDCFIKRLQRTAPGGSFGVNIPAIAGNKYGFPNVPAYSVTVTLPKYGASVASDVVGETTGFISRLLGGGNSVTTSASGQLVTQPTGFPKYAFAVLVAIVLFILLDRSR
jgi:hypothetical protein